MVKKKKKKYFSSEEKISFVCEWEREREDKVKEREKRMS